MFTGSTQAQSLARFDFNGQAGQGENGGPTQTGWSGFDSNSVGGNHHFGPPGSIAINIGSVGLNSVRDRLPEYEGVSNLESSPVVDVTRDFIISSNATLEVRVRFLEPNTTYDLRWHHYEAAHDDSGNQLAVYINDNSVPANKLFETELYGQSTSNFWTDFTATSDGTGQIALFSGDHSSGSAANPYFNGFEVVSAAGPQIPDTDFTWNLTGLGDWNDFASWLPFTGPPNDANHTATFGNAIQNNSTVVVDSPVTINRINFDHTLSYAISGMGSVNLSANTANRSVLPTIDVQSGSHQFQAIVNLLDSTTANIASDSTLEFIHRLFLNGNTLTKTGEGTLAISNDVVLAGGTIDLQQGTISGNGAIGGDVNNGGGRISPGNSPGVLTVNGNLNNGSGGTIAMEIEGTDGAAEPQGHDQIQVTGSSTLDGVLDIDAGENYADPTARSARDNFTLIASAGGITGTFGTVNYNDVDLSADFTGANGSTRSHQGNGLFRNINYDGNNVSLTNLFALEGDADGDIDIDITDFNILASNFDDTGANAETNNWTTADFDADGDIDITDFNFLAANFADTGYGENTTGQVPEPTTWLLMLIGLAGLATYVSGSPRRKRF